MLQLAEASHLDPEDLPRHRSRLYQVSRVHSESITLVNRPARAATADQSNENLSAAVISQMLQ